MKTFIFLKIQNYKITFILVLCAYIIKLHLRNLTFLCNIVRVDVISSTNCCTIGKVKL